VEAHFGFGVGMVLWVQLGGGRVVSFEGVRRGQEGGHQLTMRNSMC
jgi:hypothetical protein